MLMTYNTHDSSKKPVILIGLGGIGSRIVDDVYARIDEQRKRQVAAVVLDTDSGDLSKLKHVKTKIQTAPMINVGSYVARNPEVMEWFPHEHRIIREKMMQSGAGQIRSISRLALYSAIQDGKLSRLDKEINRLFESNDNDFGENISIIIIGSITGGTCAGSFIQLGMYVRDYFKNYMPNISVNINGAFILPDILIKNALVPKFQYERIMANAYASLKELNATLSSDILQKHTIRLEYKPQMDDTAVSLHNKPYNSITFFDYENSDGEHLPTFEDYHQQVVNSIHHGYIGPSSDKHYSILDNIIEIVINKGGDAFYGGVSTGKLIFPYEQIMEYLNHEWILEELHENWVKIDREFEELYKDYERDLMKGVKLKEPQKSDFFIKSIDRINSSEVPEHFLYSIYRQTHVYDDMGKETGDKAESFTQAVEKHMLKSLEQDGEYRDLLALTEYGNGIDKKTTAVQVIGDCEYHAENLYKSIHTIARDNRRVLLNDILLNGCNKQFDYIPHSFASIVIKESMHPLAIRYLLYKSKELLNVELQKAQSVKEQAAHEVGRYKEAYSEYDKTKEDESDARPTPPEQILQTIIQRTFNFGEFNRFIREYKERYGRYIQSIEKYAKNLLKEQTIDALLRYIEGMLKDWDNFFELLKNDIASDIGSKRDALLAQHDRNGSDIYVYALKESKQALWNRYRVSLSGLDIDSDISQSIFRNQYQYFCDKIDNPNSKGVSKEDYIMIIKNSFMKLLQAKVGVSLNISVEEAIEREGIYTLSEYIRKIVSKNKPWINANFRSEDAIRIWGVSNRTEIEDQLKPLVEGNIVSSSQYQPYEISYMIGYLPLSVHDFAKFSVHHNGIDSKSIGSYFRAYHKIIDDLVDNPNTSITPHIDKDWHEYLPDYNPFRVDEERRSFYQAFLAGVVLGWLKPVNIDGERLYAYDSGTNLTKISKQGSAVKEKKFMDLYKALEVDPRIKKMINQRYNALKAEIANADDEEIHHGAFTQGLLENQHANVLNELLNMSGSKHPQERKEALELLAFFKEMIEEFYRDIFGELHKNKAAIFIRETLQKMWTNAPLTKEPENEASYIEWKNNFYPPEE
jgi:hypothetical protein